MGISVMLKKLLEESNMTQKQLAAELRIPASTLGGYIQGTSEPDLETVKMLAKFFDCTVDYLVGNKSNATLSLDEDELLRIFRRMDSSQQEVFLDVGKVFLKHSN